MCSLEVIGKVVYNIACMPKEEKYRILKLTNEKIKRLIVNTPGAMEAMTELGWEESDGVLQCTKNLTMAQVRSACLLQAPGVAAIVLLGSFELVSSLFASPLLLQTVP